MAKQDAIQESITRPASIHTPLAHTPSALTPAISTENIELTTIIERGDNAPTEGPHFSLPRADGGKDAWLVLFACFILEALVWGDNILLLANTLGLTWTGFPFAFGVFNDYYSTQPEFQGSKSSIAAIGTTSTGIMYFGAPIIYPILRKYPHLRKPFCIGGFAILLAALISASFATTIPQLLATQGILYSIGGSIHYFPAFLYLDEWFFSRKGLAYGVVWAGAGTAGAVLPLTLEWILSRWGFRAALRAWAVISFVLTTPAIFFLKGRLPVQHASTGPQRVEIGFLHAPAFWILGAGVMVQGLGHFLPTLYMPLFARAVGLPGISGTVAISLANAANVLGALGTGYLVDKFHVTTAINVCAAGTVVAVFLFWTFAVHQPVLYVFALLYGLFAGGFSATWSGATGPLREKYPATQTGMVIALFSALKGIGAVISGPLSGALLESTKWQAGFGWVDGYGSLIIFSGVTAAATGTGWCCKRLGML